MLFDDNVVIVTGASSGIGAAAAVKFAEAGAYAVLVGRNTTKLNAVAEKCSAIGKTPVVVQAELTSDTELKNVVETTIERFGKLNVLVNNAGTSGSVDIASEDIMEKYDQIVAINLRSAVCLTNLSMPHLVRSRGNVVNVSSIAAHAVLYPGNAAYCASKAGLDHFTKAVALDVASHGVRANSICPGPVRSDFIHSVISDESKHAEFWDTLKKRTALGEIIEPGEVADLILYLASDKAKNITGSSFVIDGGMLLKG